MRRADNAAAAAAHGNAAATIAALENNMVLETNGNKFQ